jgi:hypothetical protein
MKRKTHYPVTHTSIKTFTACSGAQQISIDNAFLGRIPERILIALVKNTAFVGSASTNRYHFQHYMTNLVVCKRCSASFRTTHYGLLFTLWDYQVYKTLFSSTGIHHDDRAHMITLEMFTKGFYILGFDITPDRGRRRTYKPATSRKCTH